MKYLIVTEGSSELALISVLIDKNIFKFNVNDMLDDKPHHKRQLDGYVYALIRSLPKGEEITIIRIGDTLKDNLKIDKSIKSKIKEIIKVCTKPELEKLIIINENLTDEFNKTKDKPSTFLKKQKIGYSKSYKYMYEYFCNIDIIKVLSEYKRIKKHKKDEYYLIDFIRIL